MRPRPRAPARAYGLRPLGLPSPASVELDRHGLPARVTLDSSRRHAGTLEVEDVQEVWRIAEEWWREAPIRRTYCRLAVDSGRTITLFHDDTATPEAGWYEQRY